MTKKRPILLRSALGQPVLSLSVLGPAAEILVVAPHCYAGNSHQTASTGDGMESAFAAWPVLHPRRSGARGHRGAVMMWGRGTAKLPFVPPGPQADAHSASDTFDNAIAGRTRAIAILVEYVTSAASMTLPAASADCASESGTQATPRPSIAIDSSAAASLDCSTISRGGARPRDAQSAFRIPPGRISIPDLVRRTAHARKLFLQSAGPEIRASAPGQLPHLRRCRRPHRRAFPRIRRTRPWADGRQDHRFAVGYAFEHVASPASLCRRIEPAVGEPRQQHGADQSDRRASPKAAWRR